MLRHSRSASSLGIRSGDPETLREMLPGWYHSGRVLVETSMPFTGSAVVVIELGPEKASLLGTAARFALSGGWTTIVAPIPIGRPESHEEAAGKLLWCQDLTNRLERDSLRLARRLLDAGARGPLSLHWGLIDRSGFTEAVTVKADLRHGSISQLIELYKNISPPGTDRGVVHLYEARPPVPSPGGIGDLLALLRERHFEGAPLCFPRPGGRFGVLPLQSPDHGHYSLAIFGPHPAWVETLWSDFLPALKALCKTE